MRGGLLSGRPYRPQGRGWQVSDWLDRGDLLDRDIDPDVADTTLDRWGCRGNDGRRCIEADRLDDYLGLLDREGRRL